MDLNMGLFSVIKRNSKLALRGSWGRAIIILLIMVGVSVLITAFTQVAVEMFAPQPFFNNPTMESYDTIMELAEGFRLSIAEWIIFGASAALSVLLVSPLSLGAARWYYNLVHGSSMPVTELFYYFERGRSYARAILYEINIGIRSMLWAFLFYLPPSVIFGIAVFFLSGNEELSRAGVMTATLGIFLSAALYLLMTIFFAACVCRYALTPYLMAEDPDLTVRKAIKLSIAYTKGFRFSIVWFGLSYTGWFLLLVFFWPMLYVTPYYSTGMAMYSRFIIEKNRSTIEVTQEFSAEIPGEEPPYTGELERSSENDNTEI